MHIGIIARRTLGDCIFFTLEVLLGFLTVGLPCMVLQRLLVYGIPYSYIPHLIFYIIPECLQYLLPLSLMTGVAITFARMGSEKEIVILRTAGIQPTRLVYPILALSFIISFGAWFINDISAICRESGIRNVLLNGADKIVNKMLKTNGEIITRQLRIKVDDVENGYLHNVSIHYVPSPLSTPIDIEAQTARIQTDKKRREFIIELSNCMFRRGRTYGSSYRKIDNYSIPIDAFLTSDAASNITNAPMIRMIKEFSQLNKNIKDTQKRLAYEASTILLTGEYKLYNKDSIKSYRSCLNNYTNTHKKAIIEPYRRFTMGFSCFCMVIFSAPLAIYFHKRNIYTNIAICFISSAFLFFFLFLTGLNLGKQGLIPPWMICFADIILFVLGAIMLKYVSNK